MIRSKVHHLFKNYFEIAAFTGGLILLACMNPHASGGPDLCLFNQLGIPFCPGEGLGHSIAFTFHGELYNALKTNILGPFSIIIIGGRIIQLLGKNYFNNHTKMR